MSHLGRSTFSQTCILDDFPHKAWRVVGQGTLVFRYEHRFGAIRVNPVVLRFGQEAYHRWYTHSDREVQMSFLRQVTEVAGAGKGTAAVDPVMAGAMPALHEFLTALVDEEGGPRVTATLGISTDGERWLLRLADRQTGTVCFHAGTSLQDALQGLEERLQAGTADWRADAFAKPRKKKG